jgi:hypothetical protein
VGKARLKSKKYEPGEVPLMQDGTSTKEGSPIKNIMPKRRGSASKEELAAQLQDQFDSNITTVFAAPSKKKHYRHSSSGEIIALKTLTLHDNSVCSTTHPKVTTDVVHSSTVTVTVSSIKVKNLVSKAYIGKANPYIVITLGGVRLKTKVKWNESSTEWSERVEFPSVSRNLRGVAMDVKVYDKERLARKTLLGAVTLAIDGT